MTLKGSISTISLSGIMQLLSSEKKTGIMKVKQGAREFQIFFLEGAIVYAIESLKESRLGSLLRKDGYLTENQIVECLRIAKEKKQYIGKTFVDKGYISASILEKYIYRQVEEIITGILLWEEGEFEYIDSRFSLKWLEVVKLNPLQLMMDSVKYIDEMATHKKGPAVYVVVKNHEHSESDDEDIITEKVNNQPANHQNSNSDPPLSPMVKMKLYKTLITLKEQQNLSFGEIADRFESCGIPAPEGMIWCEDTVSSLYRQIKGLS